MGKMSNPTTTVPTPVRKDRRGGIKSVIGDFVSAERLAVATNLQWVADNCDFPKAAIGLCYAENPVTDNKEFGGLTVGDGPIFALYAGVQCYLGNNTDYEERARAQLESGEGRGVEEVLWEYGMSAGGAAPAQTSWIAAVGQADEAADTLYVGRPIIMMSRAAAVRARAVKAIFGDDQGNLWTANGTPVIASAAAPDTTLIVFGWVTVYASALTSLTVPNPIVNQEMALAERVYGIAVDCNFALHYDVSDEDTTPTLTLVADKTNTSPGGTVVLDVTTSAPVDSVFAYDNATGEPFTTGGVPMTMVAGDATHWRRTASVYPPGRYFKAEANNADIFSNVVQVTSATAELAGWTKAELEAFADAHEPPIQHPSGATKAELLAIILAALDNDEEQ